MTTMRVRDPQPLADSLIRYVEDQPTATSILAVALRAALFECGEEQQVALEGLRITDLAASKAMLCGQIMMANRVVRRIEEVLAQLPAVTP